MEYTPILSTLLFFEGESKLFKIDTIEIEGRFWLVPMWFEAPTKGWSTPERLVALDQFQYERDQSGNADFLINLPVPRLIFDCKAPAIEAPEYEIQSTPLLQVLTGPDKKPN